MKVNKHGDLIKKRTHKFKCYNCGCKYTAYTGEWGYCDRYGCPEVNPTDYVSCQCPECGHLDYIQWRGAFRDWWKEYWGWLFALIGTLSLMSIIIFGMLNSITGSVISGITAIIAFAIAYCSIK